LAKEKQMTIGVSDFVKRQTAASNFAYFDGSWERLVQIAEEHFGNHQPGFRDGVVLVQVPAEGFYSTIVALTADSILQSSFKSRAPGEHPMIHTTTRWAGKSKANHVMLVLYSADALLENDGKRTTDCEWEIVSINASPTDGKEPMNPMTMARNFLELPGGTKTEYTAQQFAEAIAFWNCHTMTNND
jgi:hypothetical protein